MEEYIEIDLKAILFYVLRKWKPIVVLAIAAALLLGGAAAVREYHLSINPEKNEAYLESLDDYRARLTLCQDRIKAEEDKIESLQEYIDHSVMMKADYRDVYIAKATYYVDSGYKIMPEMNYQNPDKTYTLTWYYRNYLQDYTVFEELEQNIGIDAKYLMDLVSISVTNNNTLSLTVTCPQQSTAIAIMEQLQKEVEELQKHLNRTIDTHDLTLMLDTCGAYVDDGLKEKQQSIHDEMLGHKEKLIELERELVKLEEEGFPDEINIPKSFVKYFLVGGVITGFLLVCYFAAIALFSGKVFSARNSGLTGEIPLLGIIKFGEGKLDWVTRCVYKLEGRLTKNDEENNRYIAVNLQNSCAEDKNILLCSDAGAAYSEAASEAVGKFIPDIRLLVVGNLMKEANAIQLLPECDAVVVVVADAESKANTLRNMQELVSRCGKKVIGYIFVEK